jgi:hypothetical protein
MAHKFDKIIIEKIIGEIEQQFFAKHRALAFFCLTKNFDEIDPKRSFGTNVFLPENQFY